MSEDNSIGSIHRVPYHFSVRSCNDYPKVFIAWYSNPYSCIEIIEQYEVKTLIPSLFHLTNSEEFAKQIDSKSNYSNISEDMRK
jgi:hypothetical protein